MTRRNKFGAVATVVDGIRFHSKGEAKRWQELRLLQRAGEISQLKRQVSFPMFIGCEQICTLILDFTYETKPRKAGERWTEVFEDFKGVRTPEYKLKAKLFKALYGREILETGRK